MFLAIATRVGQAALSLLAVIALVFGMTRLIGDPAFFLTGPEATEEDRVRIRRELGLDQPIPVQFAVYLSNLAQGDLGMSFRTRTPVADLIAQRLPATLTMGVSALALTLVVAVPLGVYAGYWRGGPLDKFARGLAALGQAIPSFWLGLILILVFAVYLRWLPAGGYGEVQHLLLPSITLAFGAIAGLTRLLRSSMIEVLGSDYVKFHRIKGVPENEILWRHGLRNAGLTSLTYIGIVTAGLLTGSVLVETVYVWPGIGRLMIEGIEFRDFNVVLGVMLLFSTLYIGVNLIVDLLYTVLNPRLR
jgi:peptide/nickel transport system permease protein